MVRPKKRAYNLTISADSPGLGNKIFEVASLVGIAVKNGMNVVLPPGLGQLKENMKLEVIRQFPTRMEDNKTNADFGGFHFLFKRKDREYDERTEQLPPQNTELNGYYHSAKYFQSIEVFIRKEFDFKDELKDKVQAFKKSKMAGKENYTTVGIHIRRGDFLLESAQKFGDGVATPEYMKKAVAFFENKFPNVVFFVAGNGGYWAKENVHAKHLVFSESFSPIEDMALLSSCEHTIATSGTFSWWVGWLTNGITLYYEGYPIPGTKLWEGFKKEDFFPPNWILMQ
jgi:galactoside 2-L-fucosyltransferase 1/2